MTALPTSRIPRPQDSLEWVDRERPLRFEFEGAEIAAYAGDSIASALWASGVRALGHSLKKRRPRGLDANVAVLERGRGVLVAEATPVEDGMVLRRLHGPAAELPAWTAAGSKLAPGGLHDPARLAEPGFERSVRSWVGLGPLPPVAAKRWTSRPSVATDVLVIGAGLAGLSAALAAAERGVRVLVVDGDPGPGGRALTGREARRALGQLLSRLTPSSGVDVWPATTALGIYDDGLVPVLSAGRLTKVRARRIVIATGRIELPAIFRNNDLPGIVSMPTAERLLVRYGVLPCRRAVVLTAGDDGHRVVPALLEAGVEVAAVVDARQVAPGRPLGGGSPALAFGGSLVQEALAAPDGRLAGVVVHGDGRPHGAFACDGLVVAAGSVAADQLVLQAQRRHAPQFGPIPVEVARGIFAAGALRGLASPAGCVDDGARVGALAAASLLGGPRIAAPADAPDAALDAAVAPLARVPHPSGACFVDLDEDVELGDLEAAIDEGFDQVGLLNAYTKFGRGVGQSKTSHAHAVGVLEGRLAAHGAGVGPPDRPVPRPPALPVPMRALAGRRFCPRRRTPIHDWHVAQGAELLVADDWDRPALYPSGESAISPASRAATIDVEVRRVRQRAGIIDVGTLGKIDVAGRDAGAFLEQVYAGWFANMRIGSSRYALLCDDAGAVVDDGIAARFAHDRFYLTTTTGASAAVYRELQRRAIELACEVVLTNLTGAVAAFNVAGPRAPRVVAAAADDPGRVLALPYLGALETRFAGVTARVLRVGFVGEVGYELHLPASEALSAWRRLLEIGAAEGLRPFGVEAQRMLRLEKGHLLVGQDTDALSTPFEVGLGWAVKMQKPAFVGRRSLAIRSARPPSRALVGFEIPAGRGATGVADAADVRECHLVVDGDGIVGRVTSVGRSPSLDRTIGLAFVGPASASPGCSFAIRLDRDRRVAATVVPTPFFDPENRRQHEAAGA
jgi:sarcosine oxidase subunit alpha